MKKLFFIIAIGLLLFSSCAKKDTTIKPTPGNEQSTTQNSTPKTENLDFKASDFFPLTKDIHMKYKGTGMEFAERDVYVDYINGSLIQLREINPGTILANVYEVGNGMLKRVYSHPEMYYRKDFTSLKGDEEILIKEPIKVGTQWTLKDGMKRSITGIEKEISTPSGNYKALEVTTVMPDSKNINYYVKGLGFVKSVFIPNSDPSSTITTELEKIESNVPYIQSLRFFFPDFENDKIVFITRPVEIMTNQDMKYKFQKELKTIPDGSKLTKVLTPGAEVLGTTVDEAKSTATVDLSSKFVSEMNAGTGMEGLILNSIVSTFGNYYQVNKVIITVEGKPYSSGHIIMKPGEAMSVDTSKAVEYKDN